MKKVLLSLGLLLLLFVCYLLINTARYQSTQLEVDPVPVVKTPAGATDRFVEAISIRTVSFEDPADFDSLQFEMFNEFLARSYPNVYEEMELKLFNEYSHLFKWTGTDPDLDPIILMGHIDVVPIASLYQWSVHPFTEGVKNDTIYGRGALDNKLSVIGIMEAAEQLIKEGYQPQRTIYLSFGHDEEVLGLLGAKMISQYLYDEGIRAAMVLDEGSAIVRDQLPNIEGDIALIGLAEKGYLSLELQTNMAGGHSSSPAPESSIDVLASAIAQLKAQPFTAKVTPVLSAMIDKIGPEQPFLPKLVMANKGIFKNAILGTYAKSDAGSALIRTTISPTIFEAGIKENVIPTHARAVINFRILPGETTETVIEHVRKSINDERVQVSPLKTGQDPSPISPTDGAPFALLDKTIKQVYPQIKTTPFLVIAATDARYFSKVSDHVFRFGPFTIHSGNQTCFHGIDERIPVSEFEDAIRLYRQLMINGSGERVQ